jgi:sec-independent protein translocase protein TatA
MFSNVFGWQHLVVLVGVIALVFGAARLPVLARSVGSSLRILRKEVADQIVDSDADRKGQE